MGEPILDDSKARGLKLREETVELRERSEATREFAHALQHDARNLRLHAALLIDIHRTIQKARRT